MSRIRDRNSDGNQRPFSRCVLLSALSLTFLSSPLPGSCLPELQGGGLGTGIILVSTGKLILSSQRKASRLVH